MISEIDLEKMIYRLDRLVQKYFNKFWDIYKLSGYRKQDSINQTKEYLLYQECDQRFATTKELQEYSLIVKEILRLFEDFQKNNYRGKLYFINNFFEISSSLSKRRKLFMNIKGLNMEERALKQVMNKYIAKDMKQLNDNEIQSLEISQEDRLAVRTINEH